VVVPLLLLVVVLLVVALARKLLCWVPLLLCHWGEAHSGH
jgi:hypothetical protein